MTKSKGWNWKIASDDINSTWKVPSIESYYLLNRWSNLGFKDFLDLGCGIGRHTVLFAGNGFNTCGFDISKYGLDKTKEWLDSLNLSANLKEGDMLDLPYENDSFDCILCRNVISHQDTLGVKQIIKELYRVLKDNGEVYLTLGSKSIWGFKQTSWPLIDENTRLRMEEGTEYKVPHFYADYDLIKTLFKDFKIEFINHIEDFYESNGKTYSSFHYHVLIKK